MTSIFTYKVGAKVLALIYGDVPRIRLKPQSMSVSTQTTRSSLKP